MPRKSKSGKQTARKVKADGRAIAALQAAAHREKLNRRAAVSARGGFAHYPERVQHMAAMLTTKGKQEIAYLHQLANPFQYIAHLPVTVLTGLVESDLYSVRWDALMIGNATGYAFAFYSEDKWNNGTSQYIGPNGNTGKPLMVTIATYAGSSSPVNASTATGVVNVTMPNVSPDISADASLGTEYALVSGGMMIRAESAADEYGFRGSLFVVRTKDPERYPVNNIDIDTVLTDHYKQGSQYEVHEYRLSRSGKFIPVRLAVPETGIGGGYFQEMNGVTALGAPVFPYQKQAFEWHRVSSSPGQATNAAPGLAFFAVGWPTNQTCRVTAVSNYQIEKYPTARVLPSHPALTNVTSDVGSLNQIAGNMANAHRPHVGNSMAGIAQWFAHNIANQFGFGNAVQGALQSGQLQQAAGAGFGQLIQGIAQGAGSALPFVVANHFNKPSIPASLPATPERPMLPTSIEEPLEEEAPSFLGKVAGYIENGASSVASDVEGVASGNAIPLLEDVAEAVPLLTVGAGAFAL
jgi:hypothetical protein